MIHYFLWNDKNEKILREEWAKNTSSPVIAAMLGTSKNSVIGKVHRLGLSLRGPKRRPRY